MKVTFKQFNAFIEQEEVSDEQINEIFGFFKKETPAELRARREKLRKLSPQKKKELDVALKAMQAGKKVIPGKISDDELNDILGAGDRAAIARNDRSVQRDRK